MADAVLVSSSFLPGQGGIESYLAELCDHLAPRLAVVAAAKRDGKTLPADLGYPTYGFEGKLLWPGRRAADAVIDAARREGTDKIVFGTPWPLVLMAQKLTRAGLRYAVIVHGAEMLVPSKTPAVSHLLAPALAGAELLLPVSDFTARATAQFLEAEGHLVPKMELLRARVDLERFSPDADAQTARRSLGITDDEKVVLCFGRLVPRKGVDRLIRLMPELARRVPNTVLVIAGTGPLKKKLERQAAETQVSNGRVLFAGRVPDEQAPGVYAMADVFALPVVDRWFGLEIEGLGVVLLEAAACHTPAVTGRSGGTPEALIDSETGYVVDAVDESALLAKIERLLTHPEEAERMGRRGRKHVEANFSDRAVPESFLRWLGS